MSLIKISSLDVGLLIQIKEFVKSKGHQVEIQEWAADSTLPSGSGHSSNVIQFPGNKVLLKPLRETEIEAIKNAIGICQGNITLAAKSLKIGRATLYRKLKEYAISFEAERKKAS